MPKVLLACHQFFPKFYTGTEILVLETADELVKRGYQVEILSFEPYLPGDIVPSEPEMHEEEFNGHRVWKIVSTQSASIIDRLEKESNDDSLRNLFERVIENFKPDICHVFHLMRLTHSFVEMVASKNIKCYFTSTDYWMLCPTYQLLYKDKQLCNGPDPAKCFSCLTALYCNGMKAVPLKVKLGMQFPYLAMLINKDVRQMISILTKRITLNQESYRMFENIFISNNFMLELFEKNKFKNSHSTILPFPIPQRSNSHTQLSTIGTESKLRVGFIGTLRESKGPQVLIKACTRLKQRNDICVYIWGEAPDKAFMGKLTYEARDLDFVKFCGTFKQESFSEVLSNLDVVVVPSTWYENTPLTALSVLNAKRVLIVSDMGGLSSLVENGKTGFVFRNGDDKQLASIVEELANDREKLVSVSENIVKPTNIYEYVSKIEEAYMAK